MLSNPWEKWVLVVPILGTLLLLNGAALAEPAPTGVVARAEQLFACVEKRFDALQTLQYTVERNTQSARHTMQERWQFRFRQPDNIRIDYQQPQDRVILVTSSNLVEYLPAVRKAMRTNLALMKSTERLQRVGGVLARVSVDGLRVGDTRAMLGRVRQVRQDEQQAGAWWMEGEGPRFRVLIDAKRQVVLTTELWDARGDIKLRTTAEDFVEATPDQWFPQRLTAVYGTAEGTVTSTMRLSAIRVNASMDPTLFEFVPDKKVAVLER